MLVGTEPPEGPAPAPWGPQAGRRHLSPWQTVSSSWRNFILMFAVKTLENAQSRGLLRDQRARPEDVREARTFPAQPQRQPTPGRLLKSPTRCRGEAGGARRRGSRRGGAPGDSEKGSRWRDAAVATRLGTCARPRPRLRAPDRVLPRVAGLAATQACGGRPAVLPCPNQAEPEQRAGHSPWAALVSTGRSQGTS